MLSIGPFPSPLSLTLSAVLSFMIEDDSCQPTVTGAEHSGCSRSQIALNSHLPDRTNEAAIVEVLGVVEAVVERRVAGVVIAQAEIAPRVRVDLLLGPGSRSTHGHAGHRSHGAQAPVLLREDA